MLAANPHLFSLSNAVYPLVLSWRFHTALHIIVQVDYARLMEEPFTQWDFIGGLTVPRYL